ncbi:short-chain dehydrogenase/reductase SDR [Kipferlia bialata]|uniref:Short-chain dehydrogenase/reductase SDR n=1 Tax=Kipferlia bialata TaxID=797122 RepID=A0A9K3CQ70_9EUKA|nr:short-chain dehydrogenase/reductase SDR [Kipferlia bialata]|eukprot:g1149.t1
MAPQKMYTETGDAREWCLITGASSGLGAEFIKLAAPLYHLVLVARRTDRMEALAANLFTEYGCMCIIITKDLAEEAAGTALVAELTEFQTANTEFHMPTILVNNAGFGYIGKFHEQDWARNRNMIMVNVTVCCELAALLIPNMVEKGFGRVLNVASIASYMAGPNQSIYFASKAFLRSWSEATWMELQGTGVTTTALCPGPVSTEWAAEAGIGSDGDMMKKADTPEFIARLGWTGMLAGKRVAMTRKTATQIKAFACLPKKLVLKKTMQLQEPKPEPTAE